MKHRIEPIFQNEGTNTPSHMNKEAIITHSVDNNTSRNRSCCYHCSKIYSIQVLLVLGFIVQVAVIFTLLLSLANYAQSKSSNPLTSELMTVTVSDVFRFVESFISAPPRASYLASKIMERAPMDDYDTISRVLWDVHSGTDNCFAALLATVSGRLVGLLGMPAIYKFTLWPEIDKNTLFIVPFNSSDGSTPLPSAEASILAVPYSLNRMPWYDAVVKTKDHVWRPVFLEPLYPSVLFVSSLHPVLNRLNHEMMAVIGLSFSVSGIADYLQKGLSAGKTGVCYVIERDGNIVATSSVNTPSIQKNGTVETRVHVSQSPEKLITESAAVLTNHHGSLMNITMDDKIYDLSFDSPTRGKVLMKYTIYFDPLGIFWIIVVAIPESDFDQAVRQTRLIIIYVSLGVAIVSIIVSVVFSIFITSPLRRLGNEMEKIAQMELNPTEETGKSYSYKTLYEVQQLQHQFNKMKGALKYFGRYVPVEVVRILLKENTGESSSLSLRSGNVAVLFSDIVSFTSLSEQLSADILLSMLEQYFNDLSTIILQHEGTLDKYIGDSIMAFWGMPSPVHNYIQKSVRSAVMMQKRLAQLEEEWQSRGLPAFRTRIGMNCGPALVGNIGSPLTRVSSTALGDTVNLASRLEALNKFYGSSILITEKMYNEIHEEFLCRPLDRVTVVGKSFATNIYEVIGFMEDATSEQVIQSQEYQIAYELYRACQFQEAKHKFEEYHERHQDDYFAGVMVSRCREYEIKPPSNWDGSFRHDAK